MAYKALYRSYRPTRFSEVVGQKHVIQTLKNSIKENRTSHAYVFSGLRGIGKTTIARILAKAVNCQNPIDGEPCNNCPCCKAINNNETTDIVELDAASNNGVDEIRNILDKVNFLPSFLNKKVYIIDEAHMLSTAAFNALLKTLEEPPAYVMFILATTEPHKIPLTILSRCQRFDFKQLSIKELTDELVLICQKENIQINKEALEGIAEAAEGGMRDALSILDQASVYANNNITLDDVNSVTGNISTRKLMELIEAFNADDATRSLNLINELLNMGKEVSRLTTNVIQFCRDILLYKSLNRVPADKYIYTTDEFKNLAANSDRNRLFYYIDVLVDVQNKIRFTNSQKIYLEVGVMKIVNSVSQDIDILGRIKALEDNATFGGNPEYSSMSGTSPAVIQQLSILENKVKKLGIDLEKAKVKEFEEKVNSRINVLEDVVSKTSVLPNSLEERVQVLESRLCDIENNSAYEQVQINDEFNRQLEEKVKQLETNTKQNASIITELLDKAEEPASNNGNNDEVILEIINKLDDLEKQVKEIPIGNSDDSMRIKELEAAINQIQKSISTNPTNEPSTPGVDNVPASAKKTGYYQMSLTDYLSPEAAGDLNKKADDNSLEELKTKVSNIENEINNFKEHLDQLENKSFEQAEIPETNVPADQYKFDEVYELIDMISSRVDEINSKVESIETAPNNVNNNVNSDVIDTPVTEKVIDSTLQTTVSELKTHYFVLAKAIELMSEKLDNLNGKQVSDNNDVDYQQITDDLEFTRGLVKELQDEVLNLNDKYVTKEEYKILSNKLDTLEINLSLLSNKCGEAPLDIKKRNNPFETPLASDESNEAVQEEITDESVEETFEAETPVVEVKESNDEPIVEENKPLFDEPVVEEITEEPNLFTEDLIENNSNEEDTISEPTIIDETDGSNLFVTDNLDEVNPLDSTEEAAEETNEIEEETAEEQTEEPNLFTVANEYNNQTEEQKLVEEPALVVEETLVEEVAEPEQLIEEEVPTEEVPNEEVKEPEESDEPEDLTEKIYDIHIVENILHESRQAECRAKKEQIIHDWPKLMEKVGGLLMQSASLLVGADVKANGKTGLIITFPSAQLCNLVMEPKAHRDACEVIKLTYDTPYDFIAIPEDDWVEKRIEYHNQFRMGISYPTLTPFNNPSLRIVKVSKEPALSERQKLLKKADDFFGTDD